MHIELKELLEILPSFTKHKEEASFLEVGKKVFVRTVTYHYIGLIVGLSTSEVVLKNGSWVADSGKFSKALAEFKFPENAEIEYIGKDFAVNRSAIVDVFDWQGDLPSCTQ